MDMREHLLKPEEGTNDQADIVVKNMILTSDSLSSESSIHSRDIGIKDDASVESKGVVLTPDVFDFNPRLSTHESPMMMQAGGYDPNRIPASIFASKPATPAEWSVASNESLFSIHMGNSSFSRDHVFVLYRSGDTPDRKSQNVSGELKMREERLPEAAKVESELLINSRKETGTAKGVYQEKIPSAEDVRNSTSSSVHSFQFPGLQGNVGGNGTVKVVMENASSKKHLGYNPHPPRRQGPEIGRPRKAKGRSWLCYFCRCSLGC